MPDLGAILRVICSIRVLASVKMPEAVRGGWMRIWKRSRSSAALAQAVPAVG